ncbi:hypothetical protein [Mucilaginibacter boryungensis]|uniref:Uncharacterized protein n=1 Tax=Mucilaginibacter boryungensis TaxID=768480 RepID=A0ABR9XLW0_9SPHI|nr:hypothetical protein [Mucilaginibacter boryungensis]MBE9668266.1 hypothetical protein [Mucilaginibacter boryungensis]
MILEINKNELNNLYNKAREMYRKCLQNNDNGYLKEDILIPLEQIEIKNSSIKIVFSQEINERCSWEINLTLWNKSVIIGRYMYFEDDQGNALDDTLVFF